MKYNVKYKRPIYHYPKVKFIIAGLKTYSFATGLRFFAEKRGQNITKIEIMSVEIKRDETLEPYLMRFYDEEMQEIGSFNSDTLEICLLPRHKQAKYAFS